MSATVDSSPAPDAPARASWSARPDPGVARAGKPLGVLVSGDVLCVRSRDQYGDGSHLTALWNPGTGKIAEGPLLPAGQVMLLADGRVKLVSVVHISNVLGTVNPVEIGRAHV